MYIKGLQCLWKLLPKTAWACCGTSPSLVFWYHSGPDKVLLVCNRLRVYTQTKICSWRWRTAPPPPSRGQTPPRLIINRPLRLSEVRLHLPTGLGSFSRTESEVDHLKGRKHLTFHADSSSDNPIVPSPNKPPFMQRQSLLQSEAHGAVKKKLHQRRGTFPSASRGSLTHLKPAASSIQTRSRDTAPGGHVWSRASTRRPAARSHPAGRESPTKLSRSGVLRTVLTVTNQNFSMFYLFCKQLSWTELNHFWVSLVYFKKFPTTKEKKDRFIKSI